MQREESSFLEGTSASVLLSPEEVMEFKVVEKFKTRRQGVCPHVDEGTKLFLSRTCGTHALGNALDTLN